MKSWRTHTFVVGEHDPLNVDSIDNYVLISTVSKPNLVDLKIAASATHVRSLEALVTNMKEILIQEYLLEYLEAIEVWLVNEDTMANWSDSCFESINADRISKEELSESFSPSEYRIVMLVKASENTNISSSVTNMPGSYPETWLNIGCDPLDSNNLYVVKIPLKPFFDKGWFWNWVEDKENGEVQYERRN